MPSVDWGWTVSARKLMPIMTDLQPASQKFLEVVCNCGCKSGCNTMLGSCRKHGMSCSTACCECMGVYANNPNDIDSESDKDTGSVSE